MSKLRKGLEKKPKAKTVRIYNCRECGYIFRSRKICQTCKKCGGKLEVIDSYKSRRVGVSRRRRKYGLPS